MRPIRATCQALILAAVASHSLPLDAAAPKALGEGELPQDRRLEPLKDLDGYFPFTPPQSLDEWKERSAKVRQRVQVALGLWPMPEKTPLNSVIHGWIDQGEYRVAKVYFESKPGFFVTGNLYEPKVIKGKIPGFLFAHGHWVNGRFVDQGEDGVRKEIAAGAEHFPEGGRSIMQALCVQLARMGCAVFHYDMIGYADSQQISQELAHGFATQRPEMNTTENWGLFSPQAEAHLQSVMGLQAWNSIRALDFLTGLPEIDPKRVGMTGASGGGSQTFITAALDPRLMLAFPAVMVGTAMQGGCTCENASLLRIGTGNVEFAGLFAPKPLGMTSADDWTKETYRKGFPELQQLYRLEGVPDNVALFRGEQFGHNYNAVSRASFYLWSNRHFGLGQQEPVVERDYHRLAKSELTVWDAAHPAPPSGPDFERKLLASLNDETGRQLATAKTPDQFSAICRPALEIMAGRTLDEVGKVTWQATAKEDRNTWFEIAGLLTNPAHHEQLPAIFLYPKKWNGRTVIWLGENGKSVLYTEDGELLPAVRKLVDGGSTVAALDLFGQGEFLKPDESGDKNRKVAGNRDFAGYTYGYNHSLAAQRIQDVLSLVHYLQNHERKPKAIDAIALDGTAPILLAVNALAPEAFQRVAVDTRGFRYGKLLDWRDAKFLPGGAKYGDLPGLLALTPAKPVFIASETATSLALPISMYHQAKADKNLKIYSGDSKAFAAAALDWIGKP